MAQDSMNRPLVAERFNGKRAWDVLTRDQQDAIGSAALEWMGAVYVEIRASETGNKLWSRLAAASCEAAQATMLKAVVRAIHFPAFEASDGSPLIPSLLGRFCAVCGCSQNDPCPDGCGRASDDLCTTCAAVAAALRLLPLLAGRVP